MQTMTYVTYKTGTFSINTLLDLVTVLHLTGTPNMIKQNQNRGVPCSLYAILIGNYRQLQIDNYKSQHGFQNVNKKCPPNTMLIQIPMIF